jgi:1,4-alpha-glucan branching enzyme
LLVGGGAIGWSMRAPLPVTRSEVAAPSANVRFVYVAPGATSVSLVGDFNQWNPTAKPLRRLGDGTWITDVPLPPGRYAYAFVVDGKVVVDPAAPRATGEFGENSVVMVRGS